MKPLNTIVADLEYCKELKELGVKQSGLFQWDIKRKRFYYEKPQGNIEIDNCSAWTASELGEMLPKFVEIQKYSWGYKFKIMSGNSNKLYPPVDVLYAEDNSSLVNGMAKMLIYLLKNNIISLEEVNKNI